MLSGVVTALLLALATGGCGSVSPSGVTPHPAPGTPVGETSMLVDDVPAGDEPAVSRPAGG